MKITKSGKKAFAVIMAFFTVISCSRKKDNTAEGKILAWKSKLIITSEPDKNDSIEFGQKKYRIESLSSGNSFFNYSEEIYLSEKTVLSLETDDLDDINEYLIKLSDLEKCSITLDFFENDFYYKWGSDKKNYIEPEKAKKILMDFYDGKSAGDICDDFSKNIKI